MPKKGKKGKGKGKKGRRVRESSGKRTEFKAEKYGLYKNQAMKKGAKKAKKDLSIKSMSEANSKLWETRLTIAEQSRQEYRDTARKLLLENETIHNQMHQTEKDTIDVISYLKRQDQEKDRQIEQLQNTIRDLKKEHRKESERLVDDFQQQISELEQNLMQKTHEVEIMQNELKQVKEFRRKRAQMQKELEEIKENMFAANKEHKETLQRMEQKFFEEKMRLQQEANQKIAELAERAHAEAITNLDETTRSVYKENVRVNEALAYHIEEGDKLKRVKERLEKENGDLRGDKELNEMMIQEKVQQSKHNKQLIKDMQEKIETLEKSLSHVVHEFETEQTALLQRAKIENESATNEIKKLQRTLELKTKETAKIKKLAKNILDQRTEMERFFLEALEHVKLEIAANRSQYRKDAHLAYQRRMLAAHVGHSDYPKIRTFNKSDSSTNSVFKDLEAAERLREQEFKEKIKEQINISGKVDITDLTWEQKERVLRFLFAKLNGAREKRGKTAPAHVSQSDSVVPSIQGKEAWVEVGDTRKSDDLTFLTQANVEDDGSFEKLPQIQQSSTIVQPETQAVS